MALIGDTKEAVSEGESGPVETGLSGSAATALGCVTSIFDLTDNVAN